VRKNIEERGQLALDSVKGALIKRNPLCDYSSRIQMPFAKLKVFFGIKSG